MSRDFMGEYQLLMAKLALVDRNAKRRTKSKQLEAAISYKPKERPAKRERNAVIRERYFNGEKVADIAADYHVTSARISQIGLEHRLKGYARSKNK